MGDSLMTLTRELARKEAARLQASPMLAPQSDEGRREIVDCLMRHCTDEEHARAVMTELLDSVERPQSITAEIATIARKTLHRDCPPPGCHLCCMGEDPITGAVRWASHVSVDVRGYPCARRCTCQRGRWLADCDRQQQPETPRPTLAMAKAADFKLLAGGEGR